MDRKFIGIDYHKKHTQITIMDQAGIILNRARIRSEKAAVEAYSLGGVTARTEFSGAVQTKYKNESFRRMV